MIKFCQLNISTLLLCYSSSYNKHVPRVFKAPGDISLKNTVEDFKSCDKKELINQATKKVIFQKYLKPFYS